MNKIDDLKWTRIFTPIHIPRYLIEQVRDREYSVDDFYKYHEINCAYRGENNELKFNPFSHLYVLMNEENGVKGMVWFCIDPLTKDMIIQTFSIDKEYWCKGIAVKKLAEHIKSIREKGNLNKIYWVTNYPKHSERNGFKRSKSVLMEYVGEENTSKQCVEKNKENQHGKDISRRIRKRGEHRPVDASTEQLSNECAGSYAATGS